MPFTWEFRVGANGIRPCDKPTGRIFFQSKGIEIAVNLGFRRVQTQRAHAGGENAMIERKLSGLLARITRKGDEGNIPFAIIGAMALGAYGLPRFTADIDLLTEEDQRRPLLALLQELGFVCFQETESFAQLDSEMGVLGKVDVMFVQTAAGRELLARRIRVSDDLMGSFPVIQPTDYIVLKLMAVANDPTRREHDEGDVIALLKHIRGKRLPTWFEPIQRDRLLDFGRKFRREDRIRNMLKENLDASPAKGTFFL